MIIDEFISIYPREAGFLPADFYAGSDFFSILKILPEKEADSVCPKGSRLAHFYGLPKTHKPRPSMRPILSATGTYNFLLAKLLDERLKPLSINKFTIMDPLKFVEEVRGEKVDAEEILVSYDVTSLFANVPVDETIKILVKRAFKNNWFNKTYRLNLKKSDLETLLNLAVKHQLFQFDGNLYEQVDGVAIRSCVRLRNDWLSRNRCLLSTDDSWMIL